MAISKFDRWLIAENVNGNRQYIIHTHKPRFVAEILNNEIDGNDITEFEWFDDPWEFYKGKSVDDMASILARLAREAGDAVAEYDRNLGVD